MLHCIPNNKRIKAINKDHDKHSNNELNKKHKKIKLNMKLHHKIVRS